ncbi:MAG TPA: PAS domain S-box protein [Terriglobales bacterium]|jgi:PAS domain S-box-containing protein|nr:PAS domain S-box protein [Terriglobales bacterium]
MSELEKQVEERFGVLPNFFRLAPETSEITEKLWGFAQAAYLDNPLPSVFKERLFVHLSRFCAVRYCIARHVGFLVGLGRPAGDPTVHTQSVEEVVKLLRRPFPRGQELQSRLSLCAACPAPIAEMPMPNTRMEDPIFVLAAHVFLKTSDYLLCLDALARLFGPTRLQYLLLLLAFVRAAHYWTETHPEIALEDDVNKLLATHEALADCILNDPQAKDRISESLLDELPALRLKADKAIGLLAAIVDSSEDAIVSKTLDGIITSWNAGAERLFGYTASEAVGQHISLIIPLNRRDEETVIIKRIKNGERIEHFDTIRVRKDQTLIDISLTISPVRDASGKIVGASKIARDITERKRIERELRESEERYRILADALDTQVQFRTRELERRNLELRELSGRLLESQDAERRHIARELHDSAGQTLAALGMSLSRLGQDAKNNPDQLAKGIRDAEGLVQHLTQEIRTTSYLLHPPMLDEIGLSSALSWYVQGLAERSSLQIDLKVPENFGRLPSEMELLIFRLVQESLTNIHRHSGSKTARIRIEREGDIVQVKVEDQGRGMSPERLAEIQSRGTGVGIRGMRERVRHFLGDLVIESDDSGTKVYATLPLKTSPSTRKNNTQQNVA